MVVTFGNTGQGFAGYHPRTGLSLTLAQLSTSLPTRNSGSSSLSATSLQDVVDLGPRGLGGKSRVLAVEPSGNAGEIERSEGAKLSYIVLPMGDWVGEWAADCRLARVNSSNGRESSST